ncbi:hypothetical protein Mag101_00925 [Microbulbifer agarilyticus]|uniref:Heparan-alpha-glucosaminide N-acetyltransferase catalytic domain-containing protein n=2 Tax=Microbulbifer agarilyticus TaxID=260552 RepID=A0A1Q2M9G0_9GAMM|nr:hypothetical protein Mag101_00925 [Microbulbifer agarilyticus]
MDGQPRIVAIDLMRGLAVMMMVCVHTLWMYADTATQSSSWLGQVVHFMGKGTAVFLLCMGISMTLSRRSSSVALLKRGLQVLALGFGMNALKFVVPISVFVTMPETFIQAYGWESPVTFGQLRYLVLTGDILQLAGMSLLIIGLSKRLLSGIWAPMLAGLMVIVTSKVVAGWRPPWEQGHYVADLLFADHFHVYFPVFPWISFILFGMGLGRLLNSERSIRKLTLKRMLPAGVLLTALGATLCAYNFEYHFADFFHLGPGGAIYLLGLTLLMFWLAHLLCEKVDLSKAMPLIRFCSRHVTSLYIIQWTLVCWGMGLVGFQALGTGETVLAMAILLCLTLLSQKLMNHTGILCREYLPKILEVLRGRVKSSGI